MTKLITAAAAFAFIAAGASAGFAQTAAPQAEGGQYGGGVSAPRSSQPTATTKHKAAEKKGMGMTTGSGATEHKKQMDNKAPSPNSSSNAK